MDKIDTLIAYLFAIQAFAKDIHYSASGEAFYSKHLLADEIYKGIDEQIDALIETCVMPYYAVRISYFWNIAKDIIPDLTDDDSINFDNLRKLCAKAIDLMNKIEADIKGEQSLIDSIAQDLQRKLGLITRQVG
jgi:DNA-binding ferritin-like protein